MRVVFESSHREYRKVVVDATGKQAVLPVIFTEQGLLSQFVYYMSLHRLKSRSWQDAATFAVRLLVEFIERNKQFFDSPQALFTAFSNSLFTGTIEDGSDPSGLFWNPRDPDEASKLIGHLTRFSDWLEIINEDASLQLNPWQTASRHEQRLNWAAHVHKRDNAFLSHLFRSPQTHQSRAVRTNNLPIDDLTETKSFPEEKFPQLLTEGFRRRDRDRKGAVDLRRVLITMLMHYGGLRLSEALSLWCNDVTIENGEVIVRVYHPEYGLAPDKKTNRSTYLQKHFGLSARNRLVKAMDPLFLGWKDSLITDASRKCFEVYFSPYESAELFVHLWRAYHMKQRVKPQEPELHPYAFTNRYGQPYSHRMYRDAHSLAVERIGLVPAKGLGTTPHGHRHAYGQRLAAGKIDPIAIKNAMHHKSIDSSRVYTKPTSQDLRDQMRAADIRLSEMHDFSRILID